MKRGVVRSNASVAASVWLFILIFHTPVRADPSRYPEFAQQKLPEGITPVFISVDRLAREIAAGEKPLIIDVRTEAEYRELHIAGAVSSPLARFGDRLRDIPPDRPVILY